MTKTQKHLVDTTLRDGEQSPGVAMSLEQKVGIAGLLEESGIYQIEAGTPAVGGYEVETVQAIMHNRKTAKISVWNRMNEKDIRQSLRCAPDIVHISAPVSYPQIYTKLKKNKAWLTKTLLNLVEMTRGRGYEVTVGFEDASRADICFMTALAAQLKNAGVERIRFADTVGVMVPSMMEQAVMTLRRFCDIELEIHAHNDLGMAVANTLAGAKAGAQYLDTTAMGMGERAGNCRFGTFARVAERVFDLGISARGALETERRIDELLHHPMSRTG